MYHLKSNVSSNHSESIFDFQTKKSIKITYILKKRQQASVHERALHKNQNLKSQADTHIQIQVAGFVLKIK